MSTQETDAATAQNLSDILALQRRAFLTAGAPTLAERRDDIARLRDAVKSEAPNLAAAISADFGNRSHHETLLAEIWPTVMSARHALKHLPGWMRPQRVGVGLDLLPSRARIISQPLGVIGIIAPWNYPVMLALMPMIGALAAGNRVMLKPSELTPRTSALLLQILSRLFPQEKVAVVCGDADVGAAFSSLAFDHLLFTGSGGVGRRILEAASANLTPVTLELGGKSPCIVAADGDLAAAAACIGAGKFFSAGQTCVAPDYVLIGEDRRDLFVDLLRRAVEKSYPTLGANADYTAVLNDRSRARLGRYLEDVRARGGRVIEINPSNEDLSATGKIAPTLVLDPDDQALLMQEEIFGPILPIKTYRTLDEAIDYVNARPRPLALYFFGADRKLRDRVLARTTSGGVTVNNTLMHLVAENLPFGGVGASGFGAYHGEHGFRAFSHRKGVFLQSRLNSSILLSPPYGRAFATMIMFLLRR